MASAVRAVIDRETPARGRPATDATSRGSGRTNSTPRRSSCMSRTTDGRSGPMACASVGQRVTGRDLFGRSRRRRRQAAARARAASILLSRDRKPRSARCALRRSQLEKCACQESGRPLRHIPCLLQNPLRRVPSRRAHDSAARMRRRSAHVEVPDRRAVLRPAGGGTEEEELFERELALEDVPLGEAEVAFDVERRQHLTVEDEVLDVRRVLRERVDRRCRRTPRAGRPSCLPSSDTARTARNRTRRACRAAPPTDPSGSG